MITLDTIPIGQSVCVVAFDLKATLLHKLLAIGITPGVIITPMRVAPLGDPIQVKLRGTLISLRKNECQQIQVKII